MSKVTVLLFMLLLVSSGYLVRVSYDGRRLYGELDRARSEQHKLETEYERLSAERQTQATPLRIERTARDRLAMRSATPAITQYVVDPRPAAVAASGGAR